MMKTTIFLFFILTILIFSCHKPQSTPIKVTENQKTIKLHRKDTLIVTLKSAPSTGFRWFVTKNDTTKLKFLKEKFIKDKKQVGIYGHQVFYYEALQKGKTELNYEYRRFNGMKSKEYKLTVIVK